MKILKLVLMFLVNSVVTGIGISVACILFVTGFGLLLAWTMWFPVFLAEYFGSEWFLLAFIFTIGSTACAFNAIMSNDDNVNDSQIDVKKKAVDDLS